MTWYKRLMPGTAAGVKTTPAMAAGLTDHVWTVKDIIALMDPATARIE
jgi:hypothetical protein